jgi:hypothetical protein
MSSVQYASGGSAGLSRGGRGHIGLLVPLFQLLAIESRLVIMILKSFNSAFVNDLAASVSDITREYT